MRNIVFMGLGTLALMALAATPAAATERASPRQIHDGCEVGGGGGDIQTISSHLDPAGERVVVTLRLCDKAAADATYRLHLDHAAPVVGSPEAAALGCVNHADSVVSRGPDGHQGIGESRVRGTLVRFTVPLAPLGLTADTLERLPMWATSTRGAVRDRAPQREGGDGCGHPSALTETLVQVGRFYGYVIWVTAGQFEGLFDTVYEATQICEQDATIAGISGGFTGWFADAGIGPNQIFSGNPGPIVRLDGTTVAANYTDLKTCNKGAGGSDCLLAPINTDVHGRQVPAGTLTWSNVTTGGDAGPGPDCNSWSSPSAAVSGSGGSVGAVDAGWTTGSVGACNQLRRLVCLQTKLPLARR